MGVNKVEKRTLTTGEIAQYCGVNFRTVIRWIKRGYLDAFQLPGRGDNRIEVEDFLVFLKKNNIPIPKEFRSTAAENNGNNK
jgi:excisionase family DNA binding protein